MGYTRIEGVTETAPRPQQRIVLHIVLFAATFLTCMMAGAQWAMLDPFQIEHWSAGLTYAILLMTFLSAHEFGHYIAARIHGVDATLPFFIPVPSSLMPFGTFGALIKTRSRITSRKVLFDIGVAGPLAGFAVCLVILVVGVITLPGVESLYAIHPEFQRTGVVPTSGMTFGDNLLFMIGRAAIGSSLWLPPMNEIYHYPFLCAGWFGLFVTALNMLPFGQLDGGHVLYALIGRRQWRVARLLWWTLFVFAILWMLNIIHQLLLEPSPDAWVIWLQMRIDPFLSEAINRAPLLFELGEVWVFWLIMVRVFIKTDHPELTDPQPLDRGRTVVGWVSIVILVLCLSPRAIYIVP